MDLDVLSKVPGGTDLILWFDGTLPSFHDAEVLEVLLERANASCRVKVHGFRTTPDLDEKGYYVSIKHVVITFQFLQVEKLELTDFNHQNVIDGLDLTRQSGGKILFDMKPCYGLWGSIEAADLVISLQPGKPG
jgi:hypothetical protein